MAGSGTETSEMKAQSHQQVRSNAGFKLTNAGGQPKKIIIKGFKEKPKVPDNIEDEIWDKLKRSVDSIYENKAVPDSLEELYKDMIQSVFLYLDRTYMMKTCSEKSLWNMGLILFREHFMSIPETRMKIIDELLEAIEKERTGYHVSRDVLLSLLTMLSDLSIYTTSFETLFLEKTEQFYREEGKQMIGSLSTVDSGSSVATYLKHVVSRLEQERERCRPGVGYLNSGTRKSLIAVTERELKSGTVIINDPSCHAQTVDKFEKLDNFKNRMNDILQNAFAKNETLGKTLKVSFQSLINNLNIWGRLLPEIRGRILDLSDALTQHLHNYGRYALENLESFAQSDRQRQALCNNIWAAALEMEWDGDFNSLPGRFEPEKVSDWYRLVSNKSFYERLRQMDYVNDYSTSEDRHLSAIRRGIPMRHCWHDLLEDRWPRTTLKESVSGGHLQYLLHLEHIGFDIQDAHWKRLAEVVASDGRWEEIKFLIQSRRECLTSRTTESAAYSGNLELFKTLNAINPCTDRAVKLMVQHLHMTVESSCSDDAVRNAIHSYHLPFVRYLHENFHNTVCSARAMDWAACFSFDMVKYFHESCDKGCTPNAMDGAAQNGHLDIVIFLHQNRSEGCTPSAIDYAAANNHLNVVKWLHDNWWEGCTTRAMNGAAKNGHLNVVKWLAENRNEGCTDDALESARMNGHTQVVEYLEKHPELRG
ncbi:Cullin-4 [Chytridiales sp. JEL 0842]|nr:Cullin-4 [Chytridiales sp. JEL 0842]